MTKELQKVSILMEQKRYALACSALNRILSKHPLNPTALGILAYALVRQGKFEPAETFAKKSLNYDPTNIHAHYTICEIAINKDKYPSILKKMRRGQQIAPQTTHFYYLQAFYFFSKENWQKALEQTNIGLRIQPTNQNLLNIRSRALLNLGHNTAAQNTINQALQLNPCHFENLESQGQLALLEEDWVKARQFFTEALRQNPNSSQARTGLFHAIKAKFPFYKYLLKGILWNKRNSYLTGYILGGCLLSLIPMIYLLDKFEETDYQFHTECLSFLLMSPLWLLGVIGILNSVYDFSLTQNQEAKRFLGKPEQDNAKSCRTTLIVLGISFLLILFGIVLSRFGY